MKRFIQFILISSIVFGASIDQKTKSMEKMTGFFNMYWDKTTGKIWLEISKFDQEFLYVNSLTAGVGSNDVGLDRGQLGNERITHLMSLSMHRLCRLPLLYDHVRLHCVTLCAPSLDKCTYTEGKLVGTSESLPRLAYMYGSLSERANHSLG